MAQVMDSSPAHTPPFCPADPMDSAQLAADARKISAPEPNPSFSFPMLPPPPEGGKHDDGEALSARIPSPLNLQVHHHASLPSLGSGVLLDAPQVSPSRAGFAQRSRGHHRAGSEFIGGDGSKVGPGLMSTSPTKGEGALPSPPSSMGRRRGHAHRRSGAISHHDLSAILKPREPMPLPEKHGSLPSSPTVNHNHSLDRAISQPTLKSSQVTHALMDAFAEPPADDPPTPTSTTTSPQSRPRVGFSDTLEFIPRPLSTISSETSSSISTVRPMHSASGSISSIISIGTSSPPSAKKNQYTHDVLQRYRQTSSPRPNTAESVERHSPAEISPTSVKRPSSPGAGAILKASKKSPEPQATSFPSQARTDEATTKAAPSVEFEELPSPWRNPPGFPALYANSRDSDSEVQERPRSSPETKSAKKQKKVKSWAESILSMRGKGKMPEDDTDSTPNSTPYKAFAPMKEFSLEDVNFDEDTSCVINSPGYQPPEPSRSPTLASAPAADEDQDEPGGVLDLDAHWEELDENDKGGSYRTSRRRSQRPPLSSSVFGTATKNHRRTESAPALTPISPTSGLVRRANESPMADVFEEDEEDASAGSQQQSAQKDSASLDEVKRDSEEGLAVTVVDQASALQQPRELKRSEPSLSSIQDGIDMDQHSALSQHSEVQTPRDAPELSELSVEIVDTVDEPRFSVITKSSDESTVTPTLPGSPPEETQYEAGLAVPFAYNERHAVSLPDAISFSVPHTSDGRVTTMSSLQTDSSIIGSGKPHEVGVASSYSTEDVPSLTSSASTTASVRAANLTNMPLPRSSADRSQSFSGVSGYRARNMGAVKRASLASLSRLVSSSYGERSKLSLEVVSMDDPERSEKKKKHRLSKLVKFWKSKEKTPSPA